MNFEFKKVFDEMQRMCVKEELDADILCGHLQSLQYLTKDDMDLIAAGKINTTKLGILFNQLKCKGENALTVLQQIWHQQNNPIFLEFKKKLQNNKKLLQSIEYFHLTSHDPIDMTILFETVGKMDNLKKLELSVKRNLNKEEVNSLKLPIETGLKVVYFKLNDESGREIDINKMPLILERVESSWRFKRKDTAQRFISVESDLGMQMNHANPTSSPLPNSLSSNSQSSEDGQGKLDKVSQGNNHNHNHHLVGNGMVYKKNEPLVEVVGNAQYLQATKSNDKRYKDIIINISQKPCSEKDFGFSLKGGKDRNDPILIATVLFDSSADKSGLQINDEILEIDRENVTDKVLGSVNMTLLEAVRNGQIKLLVRRKLPQSLITTSGTSAVSFRFTRQQTSLKEIRKRFEQSVETKFNNTSTPMEISQTASQNIVEMNMHSSGAYD